jgi:hypothetical protein
MSSFTIEKLYILRESVYRKLPIGDLNEEILTELSEIRNQALSCQSGHTFYNLCFNVWRTLSTLDPSSKFYLPSPYLNESIKEIVETSFQSIFVLDRECLSVGSNMVLQGIKGVGKTTLLHVFAAVTAVNSNIIPLYWMCEKEHLSSVHSIVSPYLLYFLTVTELYEKTSDVNLSDLLPHSIIDKCIQPLQEYSRDFIKYHDFYENKVAKGKSPVKCLYLLDEFTSVYTRTNSNLGLAIISEFKKLACFGNTYFILTASCYNVQKCIFPNSTIYDGLYYVKPSSSSRSMPCSPSSPRISSYPDLNCSLFVVSEVRPLRLARDIVQYYSDRYEEIITEEKAAEILYHTGGVGREIHTYRQKRSNEKHSDPASLLSSKAALLVFQKLLVSPIPSIEKLAYADKDTFDDWIENLILYEENGLISFLFPSLKDHLQKIFNSDKQLQAAYSFKLQRIGFDGGSSGHSNEAFLCQYLYRLDELALSSNHQFDLRILSKENRIQVFNSEKILLTDMTISPSSLPSTSPSPSTQNLPSSSSLSPPFLLSDYPSSSLSIFIELKGSLFKWQLDGNETGLDRFWWKVDVLAKSILVYGAQLKTGKDCISYTPGKLETQASKDLATSCEDHCIAGVLVKAEMGFFKLLPFLSMIFQYQYDISVECLFILTNKQAKKAYNDYWAKYNPDEVHVVTSRRKINGQRITFEKFNCQLFDGTEWLKEVIPDSLLL